MDDSTGSDVCWCAAIWAEETDFSSYWFWSEGNSIRSECLACMVAFRDRQLACGGGHGTMRPA